MPEKPTALTTTPKMNPIMSLLMIVPYLLLTGFNPLACGRQILAGTLHKARCSMAGRQRQCESDCNESFHGVSLDNFNTVELSFTIAVAFYCASNSESHTCNTSFALSCVFNPRTNLLESNINIGFTNSFTLHLV